MRISDLVPDANTLLSLEVEELAGVLLVHLNHSGISFRVSTTAPFGELNYKGFFKARIPERTPPPLSGPEPEYGAQAEEVNKALMEAWAWLESEAFLVRDPRAGDNFFFISRRAQRLTSREEFAAYRKAWALPKGQLHPLISSRVYPAFLRGEYDTAIFQAFREVEVAVRLAGGFSASDHGTDLMRAAFRVGKNTGPSGPLTDTTLPLGEQEAMGHLFAGAFGVYRNSTGHRLVPTNPEEAAEVIMLASQLLRIVDRLRPAQTTPAQP